MVKSNLSPEGNTLLNEIKTHINNHISQTEIINTEELFTLRQKARTVEKVIKSQSGKDLDIILSKVLEKPVGEGLSTNREEAISQIFTSLILNPEKEIIQVIGAINETAIETGCFGCISALFK